MERQFPKGGVAEAVLGAGAKVCQGLLVSGCAIPLVGCKPVAGKLLIEADHAGIPCSFGEDGRCGDAETALIPLEQRGLRDWNFWKK